MNKTAIYTTSLIGIAIIITVFLSMFLLQRQDEVRSYFATDKKITTDNYSYLEGEAKVQMLVDSNLRNTTKFLSQGGCNCPYCCQKLSSVVFQ